MKQVNLKIKGCKDKTRKAKIAKAVQVAKRHLMPRVGGLHVEIVIKENIGGFYGLCSMVEHKDYLIELTSEQDEREMISTVIHEMTHVKQGVRNELVMLPFDLYYWKGELIKAEVSDSFTPWEDEAYKTEERLMPIFERNM